MLTLRCQEPSCAHAAVLPMSAEPAVGFTLSNMPWEGREISLTGSRE